MCRNLRPTVFFKLLKHNFWNYDSMYWSSIHKTTKHTYTTCKTSDISYKSKINIQDFFNSFFLFIFFMCFDVEMWWNGSFLPWMCIPQISINCKMLYQYGPKFLKNAFSTFESMPRRIKAVLKVKRGQTHWYGVPINPLGECIYQYSIYTINRKFKGVNNWLITG